MRILELESAKKIECFLFGVILLLGLVFTFAIPPFQKPDENVHFLRAVALSDGQFFCSSDENGNGRFLIHQKYFDYITDVGTHRIAFNYNEKFFLNDIVKAEEKKSDVKDIGDFGSFCSLPFVAYILSAIAVLIGGLFNSITASFYLSRFINFLVLFFSLVWSYRKIKESNLRWLLIAYTLIPMVTHQATAVGYDALQLATIPIIFAITVSSVNKNKLDWKEVTLYVVSMAILLVAKPGYYFMSLLYFLIPADKFTRNKKEYIIYTILFFVICIIASVFTMVFLKSSGVLGGNGNIDPVRQFQGLLDPLFFIVLVKNTIEGGLQFYLQSFIGYFGWLDYSLTYPVYFIYILSWFAILFKIKDNIFFNKLYLRTAILGLAIFLTIGFIFGSIYLTWNPVGAYGISGVQGRYFLVLFPFLILFGAGLIRTLECSKVIRIISILILVIYLIIQLSYAIYKRYYDYPLDMKNTHTNTQIISYKEN